MGERLLRMVRIYIFEKGIHQEGILMISILIFLPSTPSGWHKKGEKCKCAEDKCDAICLDLKV